MGTVADMHRGIADAIDVQINALARQRDLHRRMADVFDPRPIDTPLPVIVPPPMPNDPDYTDQPPEVLDAPDS